MGPADEGVGVINVGDAATQGRMADERPRDLDLRELGHLSIVRVGAVSGR
jgi:hypothetical protein